LIKTEYQQKFGENVANFASLAIFVISLMGIQLCLKRLPVPMMP